VPRRLTITSGVSDAPGQNNAGPPAEIPTDEDEETMTMQLVSRSADRETLQLGRLQARTLIGGQHTGGAFCIIEAPIGPKTLAGPLHTHRHEDGCWYVIDGEFAAQIGDDEVHEGPGSLIFAPRGVAHTYWNPGTSPAVYLELCWPVGLERYLQQVGTIVDRGGDDIFDEIVRLGGEFGIDMDWASLDTLTQRHGIQFAM
jgi:mannose-6-phosphate isomerase-like protein (cupin superfamily)